MGWAGLRIELGQAVFTSYDSAGALRAQHDGLGSAPLVGSSEVIYPLGLVSRAPAAATGPDGAPLDGGGCKVFVVYDGTEYRIFLLGDHRDSANIPPLPEEGGTALHAPGCAVPSFYKIESKDGTHQIYVEFEDSSHVITIGRDGNGEKVLSLTHADGMAIEMFRKALRIKNAAGDTFIEMNEGGGTLSGNWKLAGDIIGPAGVSLLSHAHATAMGPTPGKPIPAL
jgi:hypothetical protein